MLSGYYVMSPNIGFQIWVPLALPVRVQVLYSYSVNCCDTDCVDHDVGQRKIFRDGRHWQSQWHTNAGIVFLSFYSRLLASISGSIFKAFHFR